MTILWSNNASTTVSGSITAGGTSVQLAAGTGALFPNPTGGDYYVATFYDQATKTQNEIIHVTAMAGDVATIVRAQEGTIAQAWNAGDIFANLVTAGTLRAFVQAGTGPANTSLVYVGTDVSTTPGTIICPTNPVPSSLAIGMIFDIKVANKNPGAVLLQLNGNAGIAGVRTDGSAMVAGNLVAGENYLFMYNGVNFTSTIPPIPLQPPQTTFYVRPDGNDNNSGFANDPADAFLTIQGAINAIKSRYMSLNTITIRVADGTYTSGAQDGSSYIAAWNIIGNTANPAACVVDCTSTVSGSYIPGSGLGSCFGTDGPCNMTVQGFTMRSYYQNAGAQGGVLNLSNNYYQNSVSGGPTIVSLAGAQVSIEGTANQYSATGNAQCFIAAAGGGNVGLGGHNIYANNPVTVNIIGTPTFTVAFAQAETGGVIILFRLSPVTFSGGIPNAPQYYAGAAGGVWFYDGGTTGFPGNQAGIVQAPGWVA
jgi:hypothetical protein